jgi:hypothetical protein
MAREEAPTAEAYRELKAQADALAVALERARFEGELPDDLMDDVDAALASYASNPAEAGA